MAQHPPPEQPTPLRDAAVYYAQEWDVPVFPLQPMGKEPLGACVPHGFKDATRDLRQIEAWWRAHPHANIGMPTGRVSDRFVIDIDVDTDTGKDGTATWARLINEHGDVDAPTVLTPRGGQHLYFRYVKGLSSRKLGPDIDTRGNGGYVLLPPSIVNGKSYVEDVGASFDDIPLCEPPAWIIERLLTSQQAADVAPVPPSGKSLALADLEVSDRIKFLLQHGDTRNRYPSRSEAIFAVVTALVTAGYGDTDLLAVLSDPAYTLAEKSIEKGPRWTAQEIARARRKRRRTPGRKLPHMWRPSAGGRKAVIPTSQPRHVLTAAQMPTRRIITHTANLAQEG